MQASPVWTLILGGLIRALLAAVGGWLAAHGLIDADTHQRLLSEGVTDVLGWALIGLAMLWSAVNKSKLMAWVRAALHLDPERHDIADVKANAKRETPSAKVPLAIFLAVALSAVAGASLTSCASPVPIWMQSGTIPELTQIANVEQASKAYVIIADTHTALMQSASDLRAARKLTDAQWAAITAANEKFKSADLRVFDALSRWRHWGQRNQFDSTYTTMLAAMSELKTVGGGR